MGRETVQVIDLAVLNELRREQRIAQIQRNIKALPSVALASGTALIFGLSAAHADAGVTPQEISKALKSNPDHTSFVVNGGDFAEKFFMQPEFQGGEPPEYIGSITIATDGNVGANIRTSPVNGEIIMVATNGNQFNVLEVNTDGWYKIQLADGQIGWVSGELVNFSAQPVAAPVPGENPATREPQGGAATLESPIIPGPDGIPTPSFLTPGQVIGPMGTYGYPEIQHMMQTHPDWFQPAEFSPELANTGFNQSMILEGALRGCTVERTAYNDQLYCVIQVQSGNQNGIASFFLIFRNTIADGQMGGNVGVIQNGEAITINDAEEVRDLYTQALAMTRVRIELRPSAFRGTDVFGELDAALMTAAIENLRIAIQTGTPIAPLDVAGIIQDLAQRRNVPVEDLQRFAGHYISGLPVAFRTSLVLS